MSKGILFGARHCPLIALALALGCVVVTPMNTSTGASAGGSAGDSDTSGDTSGLSASSTSAGTATAGPGTSSSTSSTSGSASSSPSTTEDDPGCLFIPCFDLPPEPMSCDVYLQDCPEGMKCTHSHLDDDSFCSDLAPRPKELGEPCEIFAGPLEGLDDCGVGELCWYFDEEQGLGECISFCQGSMEDATCPEPMTHCNIGCQSCVGICLDDCDPLLPDDCPGDRLCIESGGDFDCVHAAEPLGGYGDPCEYINVCEYGLACVSGENLPECESGGCCTPFCDLGAPECPDQELGVACVPYFDAPKPGAEHIGLCVLP